MNENVSWIKKVIVRIKILKPLLFHKLNDVYFKIQLEQKLVGQNYSASIKENFIMTWITYLATFILFACAGTSSSSDNRKLLYSDNCGVEIFESSRDTLDESIIISTTILNTKKIASNILSPLPYAAYYQDSTLINTLAVFSVAVSTPNCIEACPHLKPIYRLLGARQILDTLFEAKITIPITADSLSIGNNSSSISIIGDKLSGYKLCDEYLRSLDET